MTTECCLSAKESKQLVFVREENGQVVAENNNNLGQPWTSCSA